jgi:hypothetical protein
MNLPQRWNRFWFAPKAPLDLAICRITFLAFCCFYFLPRTFHGYAELPQSMFEPVWLFEKLRLPILQDSALIPLSIVWKVALVMGCLGLFTRPALIVAALLTFYFGGLPFNFGKTAHNMSAVIFAIGILSLSRCGDALSLDRLLFGRGRPAPAPSGEYRWPIRAVWLTLTFVFFAAGVAKIRASGLGWIFSENFQILLVQRHYGALPPILELGLWMAKYQWITWIAAASAILVELFFPLALFNRFARYIFPAGMFATQLGIGFLMNVWFGIFMGTYLFWVPWSKLLNYKRRAVVDPVERTSPMREVQLAAD